jgi:ribosomal protein L12E/L44/L45/RPP1/RPP2
VLLRAVAPCRYEQVEAIRQELKAREQVEALYQQGKEAEAAAAAAAAAAADSAAAEGQGPDDAKIADDEDAGGCQPGAWLLRCDASLRDCCGVMPKYV